MTTVQGGVTQCVAVEFARLAGEARLRYVALKLAANADRLGVAPSLVLAALEVLAGRFDPQFEIDVRLARDETPHMSHALLNMPEELHSDTADTESDREDVAAIWKAFQR